MLLSSYKLYWNILVIKLFLLYNWPFAQPVPAYVSPQVPDIKTSTERKTNPFDPLQITESRQFTYEELKKFTNNFQQFIGRGGFGNVYYGCLENKTEVAVKMLSEFSENGLDQFLAEVSNFSYWIIKYTCK